jgi:hypothetical protein
MSPFKIQHRHIWFELEDSDCKSKDLSALVQTPVLEKNCSNWGYSLWSQFTWCPRHPVGEAVTPITIVIFNFWGLLAQATAISAGIIKVWDVNTDQFCCWHCIHLYISLIMVLHLILGYMRFKTMKIGSFKINGDEPIRWLKALRKEIWHNKY